MADAAPVPADNARPEPVALTPLARRILPRGVDGRTREARRLAELVHQLAAGLPDPTEPRVRVLLVDAANLAMTSERLAHQAAAGEHVDPDMAVRVSGALGRALERLEECRK